MGKHHGRTTRRWRTLANNLRAQRRPCWLCGQPIDYSLPSTHIAAFSVDHVQPLSLRPDLAEEPSNLRAAHSRCNKSRGNRQPKPGLGESSTTW